MQLLNRLIYLNAFCSVLHVRPCMMLFQQEFSKSPAFSFWKLGTSGKDLKFSCHCSAVVKKANRMLGFIKSSISSRKKDVFLPLYKSLVRPHLEYAVQFWSPHYRRDIGCIEKVQKRATRMIEAMRGKTYEE